MAAPRFTLWTPPTEPQAPSLGVQPHNVSQPMYMPMGGAPYGMPASNADPSRQPLYYHPHHTNMVPGYQSPPIPGAPAPVRAGPTYMTAPTSQASTNGAVAAAPQSWPFHQPPQPLQHQQQQPQQPQQPQHHSQHHPQQAWAEGTLVGAPVMKPMSVTSLPGPPPRLPAPQVTLPQRPQPPTTQPPPLTMAPPHFQANMMFSAQPFHRPPVGMLPGQYRPVPPGPGLIRCSGWPRHPVPMEAAAAAAASAAAAVAAASVKASPPAQNPALYQDLKSWSRTEGLKKKGPSLAGEVGSASMNKLAKEHTVERFVALLQEHGPQEPSSEQVLNLFLSLSTHERKVVMRAGSIKAFLRDEGIIKLSGNTMVLCDHIPQNYKSEISIEEDELSGGEEIDEQQLLFEQKASSHGIHISSPPPSQSHPQSIVQPEVYFEEEEVYNPYGQVGGGWDPTGGLYNQNRQVVSVEQNVADIVSWSEEDDQALDDHLREGDHFAENISGLVNGLQEGCEPYNPTLTYTNTGLERDPSNSEQVNETIQRLQREIVFHQELNQMVGYPRVNVEYRDAETSTDPVEEDDLVDTIDSLQYDEMVARAAAAEETLVLTQAEMHVSEGLRLLKQIETVFMSLPILEQRSIVQEYVQLREDIENQISDNQELAGRNVMAIRDGAWMNTLPVLSWDPPEIPIKLQKTRPLEDSAADGSGDQENSHRPVQKPNHITTQQSHMDGGSDSAPSTRDPSPMPTSANIQQTQQEHIRRSSTRSPSVSSDHSEAARPPGMVDSAQESAPSAMGQQPESEKAQPTPSAAPDAAQMAFLSPLLQSMMISLARMNPTLAMQPQLLQATAMQHLMSMQRAGMVPGMPQVPALPPAAQGQTQTQTSTANVSQHAAAVPHMANPMMPPAMTSGTAMSLPTSMPNAVGSPMSNPMMMNPMMAMSGAGNGMNPMMQNPGLVNQPSQPTVQPSNSMQNDMMQINDTNDTSDVIKQSQANDTASSMSLPTTAASTPSPELPPVEHAPSKPMFDQPAKRTESSSRTTAPPQMRQEDLPQKDASVVRKTYSMSKGASQLQEHQVSQNSQILKTQPVDAPAKSKATASAPAPLNTTPKKPTSSASVSQAVVQPVTARTVVEQTVTKPVASTRNDPSTNVPLSEDWGDDLDYAGPVFKLDTSTAPKSVKIGRKKVTTSAKANHQKSSAAPPSQPVAAAQPPPSRRSATPPTAPQTPTPPPVIEEAVWPSLPTSATEKTKQRKPLPVVASSIKSVPVNKATLTRKPLSSVVAANGSSVSSPAKPTLAEAVKAREPAASAPPKQEAGKYSKHDELDDFESPQYTDHGTSNGRGMAGLSDFGVNDAWNDEFFPEPVSDSWQEGSKRKKKGKLKTLTSDDKEDSNFDKLIAQMMSKFPHLSRNDCMSSLSRETGPLEHMAKMKRATTQTAQENKYTGSPLLFKTAICEYWKAGTCISGDKCAYAHGKSELRTPPKHIMCTNWKKNRQCPHGDKCIFAHGEKELAKANQSVGVTKKEPKRVPSAATTASWATVKSKKTTTMYNTLEDNEECDTGDGPTCVICRDRISEAWGKTLDCGHRFHSNCIMRWIEGEERTCPMCRSHTLLAEDFPMLG